jgi:WD40 repeat protein
MARVTFVIRHGSLSTWDTRSPYMPVEPNFDRYLNLAPSYCPPLQCVPHPYPSEARSLTGVDFIDDNNLISCSADGRVCLWDVRNFSQPSVTQDARNSKLRAPSCARVSPCRTRVAFAGALGSCFVQTLPLLGGAGACTVVPVLPHHALHFNAKLDWSPCGRFLTCSSRNKAVHIIDMQLGIVAMKLLGHSKRAADVAWLRDMTALMSLGKEGRFRLWNPTMPAAATRAQ